VSTEGLVNPKTHQGERDVKGEKKGGKEALDLKSGALHPGFFNKC
jgi:hypothetical protein